MPFVRIAFAVLEIMNRLPIARRRRAVPYVDFELPRLSTIYLACDGAKLRAIKRCSIGYGCPIFSQETSGAVPSSVVNVAADVLARGEQGDLPCVTWLQTFTTAYASYCGIQGSPWPLSPSWRSV